MKPEEVSALRERLQMTWQEFADVCGVGLRIVFYWRSGGKALSRGTTPALLHLLDGLSRQAERSPAAREVLAEVLAELRAKPGRSAQAKGAETKRKKRAAPPESAT